MQATESIERPALTDHTGGLTPPSKIRKQPSSVSIAHQDGQSNATDVQCHSPIAPFTSSTELGPFELGLDGQISHTREATAEISPPSKETIAATTTAIASIQSASATYHACDPVQDLQDTLTALTACLSQRSELDMLEQIRNVMQQAEMLSARLGGIPESVAPPLLAVDPRLLTWLMARMRQQ